MKVFIEKEQRDLTLKFIGTVKELLSKLDINPETVIVTKLIGDESELLTEDVKLDDIDSVKILSIISGG